MNAGVHIHWGEIQQKAREKNSATNNSCTLKSGIITKNPFIIHEFYFGNKIRKFRMPKSKEKFVWGEFSLIYEGEILCYCIYISKCQEMA